MNVGELEGIPRIVVEVESGRAKFVVLVGGSGISEVGTVDKGKFSNEGW